MFPSAIPIIGARCHSCSHFYREWEVIRHGEGMVRCFKCEEAHRKALEMIATNTPPEGCAHCKLTFDQIADRTVGPEVKMYMCMVDGVYVPLCETCEARYVQQRKDLFGDTKFGLERKLR